MCKLANPILKKLLAPAWMFMSLASATQAQGFRVTEVFLKADDGRVSSVCPIQIVFHGSITTDGPGVVRYTFTRSDGANGPTHEMEFKGPGTQEVTTDWTLGDEHTLPVYAGWQAIKIVSPNELESSHETGAFSIKCRTASAGTGEQTGATNVSRSVKGSGAGNAAQLGPVGVIPSVPAHRRFRVTLNGFTVNRQTNEQASLDSERRSGRVGPYSRNYDGAGDEVYVRAEVFVLEGRAGGGFQIVSHRTISSPVMGDTSGFPERERAGTASPTGGLRTGDSYPSTTPWLRAGEPRPDRLPMLLWEGEVREAGSVMSIVIIPTVWEWNEPSAGEFGQTWDERLYPYMLDIFTRYGPRFETSDVGPVFQTFLAPTWFREQTSANVPIGRSLSQVISDGRVLDAVEYSYNMSELTLTYQSARAAARASFRGTAGIVEVPYRDRWLTGESADAGTASYTLYVQIEDLN